MGRPVAFDDWRVDRRSEHARAGAVFERCRRSGVVIVAVGEEDVVDDDLALRLTVDPGQAAEDRVLATGDAGIDQVETVTVTDRVRLNERRSQAPEPAGDLEDIERYLRHPSAYALPSMQRLDHLACNLVDPTPVMSGYKHRGVKNVGQPCAGEPHDSVRGVRSGADEAVVVGEDDRVNAVA